MFAIRVGSAFLLKSYNVIAVGGEYSGEYTPGETLVNRSNPLEKFITKGLILVSHNAKQLPANWIDLQIVAENYSVEDLLGKFLVSVKE